MSKEKLELYIRGKTDEEVKRIIGEAEEAAKRIIEESESKVARIKDEKLRKVRKEMDEKEKAEMSLARMEGRKRVMKIKDDFLGKTAEEAGNRLKGFLSGKMGEKYRDILTNLAIESASNIYGKEVLISANRRDRDILEKILPQIKNMVSKTKDAEVDIELDDKAIDTIGGVIAYSKDGKQVYNNTFEARLNRTFEELRGKLLVALFEG
jgi:vacuolar-type H+-ATPase subunit E/Vma4